MQIYGFSLIHGRFFPIFYNFAVRNFNTKMKYIQVKFSAEPDSQDVRDIIAALAAEVGFDSFTDEPDGLVGYCQEDLFNEETLTETMQNLPIPDVKVSFEAAQAEDKNWNEEWEKQVSTLLSLTTAVPSSARIWKKRSLQPILNLKQSQ